MWPMMLYETHMIWYHVIMRKTDISEARKNLADVTANAQDGDILLERYGKAVAVIVSPERHKALTDALEELEDIRAFDDAMAEEGENIPWEQVKADLGWV